VFDVFKENQNRNVFSRLRQTMSCKKQGSLIKKIERVSYNCMEAHTMKRVLILLLFLIGGAAILPNTLEAQINFNGGRGLVYVQSAWILDQGFLTLRTLTRSFGKVGNFPLPNGSTNAITVWDVTGRFSINYGLGKHIEVAVSPIVYGDTNRGKENIPDDLFLSLKFGSFNSPGSPVTFGFALNTRFPTGETHNIPFEPYASDNVGWGFSGLFTYSKDPLYPEEATNVHLNLGYWNHNDVGTRLSGGNAPGVKPESMTQELLYGVGFNIPKDNFNFSVEIYGNKFLQKPPPAAYSRENYVYLTPTVFYSPTRWVTLNFGVDFRITSPTDKTDYSLVSRNLPNSQPNYPGWRVTLGTQFTLLPTTVYRANERDILMQKAETRRELFEQIIRERNATESAEAELQRIKAERLRAEKELERLRRILEGKVRKTESENEVQEADQANGKGEAPEEPSPYEDN
jgi:hypothetical protein